MLADGRALMDREIRIDEVQVNDARINPDGSNYPGSTRVVIAWRDWNGSTLNADTLKLNVVVNYDLSESMLDKRRQALSRVIPILERAVADIKAWRDPNDPTAQL